MGAVPTRNLWSRAARCPALSGMRYMNKIRFLLAGLGSAAVLAGVAAPVSADEWLPKCDLYRCINASVTNQLDAPLTRADHEPWNDSWQDRKYDPPKTIAKGAEGRYGQLGTLLENSGSPTRTWFFTWYHFDHGGKRWQVRLMAETATWGDNTSCVIGAAGERAKEWNEVPKNNGEGTPYKCTAEFSPGGYWSTVKFSLMPR